MVKLNSSAPGVAGVESALKNLQQARTETFGAKWDVFGLFTGHNDSPTSLAAAEKALSGAFVNFLEKQDKLGPDRDDTLRTRVSDAVQKASQGVFEAACKVYTNNWMDRVGY